MSFIDSSATRALLNPSSRRDDRITRLEAQVAFLADRLGVPPDELDRHDEKPMPEEVARLVAEGKKPGDQGLSSGHRRVALGCEACGRRSRNRNPQVGGRARAGAKTPE